MIQKICISRFPQDVIYIIYFAYVYALYYTSQNTNKSTECIIHRNSVESHILVIWLMSVTSTSDADEIIELSTLVTQNEI